MSTRTIYWPEDAGGDPTEAWETNDKAEALDRGKREGVRVMASTYTWVSDEPVADFTSARYIARFTPEAWQRGYAVEIDPAGPQEWDCTAYANERTNDRDDAPGQRWLEYLDWLDRTADDRSRDRQGNPHGKLDSPDGVLDAHDVFIHDPAAPQWVRDHAGPFTIRVRRVTRDA
jgi:hypothetical protein